MYRLARTGSDPMPLDFNTPCPTGTVADALGAHPCPHDPLPASDPDTGALLCAIGLSDRAVREIQTRSFDPDR